MKTFAAAFCALTAIFTVTAAELVRPEMAIRRADQKCGEKCSPLCGYILRTQALRIEDFNRLPVEKAAVRCSMDEKNLYIDVYMEDKDIITEAVNDKNPKLYNIGDAVQILIKSDKLPGIWEINVSANNFTNGFYYPGAGAIVPNCAEKFTVASEIKINGTVNKSTDVDQSWQVRTTVPLSLLRRNGLNFTASENWSMLVLRSDFGFNIPVREFSSFPQTLRHVYEPGRFALLTFPAK